MIHKKTLLLSIVAPTILFIILEWGSLVNGFSLVLADITQNRGYYHGKNTWKPLYNEALRSAQSWNYTHAQSLLAPMLYDPTITERAGAAEVYGDMLYKSSGSLRDVIRIYEYSLSVQDIDRVKTKITLLKSLEKTPDPESENTNSSPKNIYANTGIIDTGSLDRTKKIQELQDLSATRWQYLRTDMSPVSSAQWEISRIIESLQTGTSATIQDW